MSEIDLVDCPFCGSDEITVEQAKKGWYSAICGNCEAEGPPAYTHKDARLAWKGRATPPSPSTAPEVDVRHEFEMYKSNLGEAANYIGDGQYGNHGVTEQADAFRAGVAVGRRAALASRPAEVGDEGLPPLPAGTPVMQIADETGSGSKAYTAEQFRQGQRDAVAAYKQKQAALQELADQAQENDMGYGDAVAADRARRGGEPDDDMRKAIQDSGRFEAFVTSTLEVERGDMDAWSLNTILIVEQMIERKPKTLGEVRAAIDVALVMGEPSHTTNKENG